MSSNSSLAPQIPLDQEQKKGVIVHRQDQHQIGQPVRKVSVEKLSQARRISFENNSQLRKKSFERVIKDPIDIIKLNKIQRTKEQQSILVQYFKTFQNLKIIQNEYSFPEKIDQFLDKCTYQKANRGEFIFHNLDKNDFFYFILKGEVASYAKKSEKNMNRGSSPINQQFGTQSTQSPQSQYGLERGNSSQQQLQLYSAQSLEKEISSNQNDNVLTTAKDDEFDLLKINNSKIGQYFEKEGNGRAKYNRIQIIKEAQSFGDLSKKFKSYSAVGRSESVQLLKIANKDFTNIFDFYEKKLAMTIDILRKQFEGLVSERTLINLSYLFEDEGEVLATGEYVYREQDSVNKLFIVKEGYLDLVRRVKNGKQKYMEKKISIISTGELFGHESLQIILDTVKEGGDKDSKLNTDGDDAQSSRKEESQQCHRFGCKSTTEGASVYWLDLNMLRRRDEFEEFLNQLNRLGVKKSAYYEDRLQKMFQVDEKQLNTEALSPTKRREQKLNAKESPSNTHFERKSTNIYDQGMSSQLSFSNINDELSSPLLKKSQSKGDLSMKSFQFQRQPSILIQNSSSSQRHQIESFSIESSPYLRKNPTLNNIPQQQGNQQVSQLFAEVIPEKDEMLMTTTNMIKFSLQKKRNNSVLNDNNSKIPDPQQVYNLNASRTSFSSTYEAGFQLKPVYGNQYVQYNNNSKTLRNQYPATTSGSKLNSQIGSYDTSRTSQPSPFTSPIKLRAMRLYDSMNSNQHLDPNCIKGVLTEKENLAKKSNTRVNSNSQIEELQKKVNYNALRISSQDTPESFERQMKDQIEKKLNRQDSGRLLARKRENEASHKNPSSLVDFLEMQEQIKIKEEIIQNYNIPKVVQLVSSGLPTFEESEKIQRLLKKSNTKAIANVSIAAVKNMTQNTANYSPRQKQKVSATVSPNISSVSLNASISKIMKNKMNGQSELNESQASQEILSKNDSYSPLKIKSFQKFNFLDEEDFVQGGGASFQSPNLLKAKYTNSRNYSPLTSLNQEVQEYEDDSSSNILKFTCESPKLKLQLKAANGQTVEFFTGDSRENTNQRMKDDPILTREDLQYTSEVQDTIRTLINKSNLSKGKKSVLKHFDQYPENNGNLSIKIPEHESLPQIRNLSEERKIKTLTNKLQEATSGKHLKSTNLLNSMGNRRYSSIGEQESINILKHSNNVFPNFINNRSSLQNMYSSAIGDLMRITRSSSGSQKEQPEQTPQKQLILKPEQNESLSPPGNPFVNQSQSSRITLQAGEQSSKNNTKLSFNQILLKKSQIRQSLHKKYNQIVSSSPYRDRIILVQESNEESQQNSQMINGINGQSVNEVSSMNIKNQKLQTNDLTSHFIVDQRGVNPKSLENSRSVSQLLQNSHSENKYTQSNLPTTTTGNSSPQKQQLPILQNKYLAQSIRYNSCERLRNINSLHAQNTPEKLDFSLKNAGVSILNYQNLGKASNAQEKNDLITSKLNTTPLNTIPARQASLQNLQTLISHQKKEQSSSNKSSSIVQVVSYKNNHPQYQNINQILKPIIFSESTPIRDKKGFSLHQNC